MMHKKLLAYLFISLWVSILTAQQTAQFETSFYFEDALGNRDTIIVGADPTASGTFNPQFGEADIIEPWDTVFEVRVAHSWGDFFEFLLGLQDSVAVLSKKIIDPGDHLYNELTFFVYAKYHPVRISWINNDWCKSNLVSGSIIFRTGSILEPGWWMTPTPYPHACLCENSVFIHNFEDDIVDEFGIVEQNINGDIVHIPAMNIQTKQLFCPTSPCFRTVDVDELNGDEFTIFPNPVTDELMIQTDDHRVIDVFHLYDLYGKKHEVEYDQLKIDVSQLSGGMYYLEILSDGKKEIHQILKL